MIKDMIVNNAATYLELIDNPDVYVFINRADEKQVRIVDTRTGQVYDIALSVLRKYARDYKRGDVLERRVAHVAFVFDPYGSTELSSVDSVIQFNQYQPPAHAKQPRVIKDIPKEFDAFLSYFFAGFVDAKEHFLDVLATMLVRRVETVQCLIGAGGIGKNTLVESFIQKLVGPSNHWMARQHDLKTNFTKWAENKQVIVYDEVVLTDEQTIATVKSRTNETFVVESKGVDARTAVNHASSFILSNSLNALGQFVNDRRASIYPLTEQPLKQASQLHNGNEVAFRDRLLSEEMVANVYWYLKGRTVPMKLNAYKHQQTFELLTDAGTDQGFVSRVKAHLMEVGECTLGDISELGWHGSQNELKNILRSTQNYEGVKLFKLSRYDGANTKVSLR